MTNTIPSIVRGIFFAVLALIGLTMALIFMVSTAVAIGIMYLVARARGKPFGIRAYWAQRQGSRSPPFQKPSPFQTAGAPARQPRSVRGDVIDVEVREVP
jgi:hypothetical protein